MRHDHPAGMLRQMTRKTENRLDKIEKALADFRIGIDPDLPTANR